ncbi:FAD-dependent oxidoreductase [Paenibacillus sp. HB172176]|uniref:FAD-dependent oxidoreductase n=1 Tax=Paenibacillus sp. HB172176 TaxID=2493690 RepID=UPI00143BC3E4|nr:FAD-dependent oxidoreductase [Paenibacillus sp. HB172176]
MKSNMPVKKEHIPELQIVRALAILAVISVHATASATIDMKDSAYYFFYNFINIFMRIGTPTFIMLSSFVLFYSYYNRPLDRKLVTGFYKKRLLYIIIPYVLFSIIYFVRVRLAVHLPVFSMDSLHDFLDDLWQGKAYSHLYFIFISIQFYLMFPILLAITKRWKKTAYWLIPLGFAVQWAFVLWNLYDWQLSNKGSWSLSYFSYFMTGAAMGIFYPKLRAYVASREDGGKPLGVRLLVWAPIYAIWLGVAITHVVIWYNARLYNTIYPAVWYEELWAFHTFFAALALIGAAYFIHRHLPRFVSATFYRLGQLSFGVYLIHLLFLSIYEKYMPNFGSAMLEHFRYLGGWLVMLLASCLTVAVIARWVPCSWMLFGNVPKKGLLVGGNAPSKERQRKSMRNLIALALIAVLLLTTGAASFWMQKNDTTNKNKRQELMPVVSVAEVQPSYDVIVVGTDPEGIAAAISAARNGEQVLLVDGRGRQILGGLATVGGLNTWDLNYSPVQSALSGKHNFLNKGIFQEFYDLLEGTSFDVNTAANALYEMVKAEPNIDLLMNVRQMEPIVATAEDEDSASDSTGGTDGDVAPNSVSTGGTDSVTGNTTGAAGDDAGSNTVDEAGAASGDEADTDQSGDVKVVGMRITMADGTVAEPAAAAVIDATQDADIAAAAGAPYTMGREDIGDPDAQMAVTLVFAMKGVTQEIWDSFAQHQGTGIDSMSAWGFPEAKNYVSSDPERIRMRGLNIGRQNDGTILINAMHILGVDPLDPASRAEAIKLGQEEAPRIAAYLKDTLKEFKDLDFAYTVDELYVRETRHIEGEYRLTMVDLLHNRDYWDAVAYGSYDVDIQASEADTGYVLYSPAQYGVPFRTLVPLKVDGLLVVGRAASFDSLPHGSARVIPVGMATGQAAGAAVKLAVEQGVTVRELSRSKELIAELRSRLVDQGMDLTMNAIDTPDYLSNKASKGLDMAVSMLLTSGGETNSQFELDGVSNRQRIVYSMNRVTKAHPDFFKGDPSVAIAGIEDADKQPVSVDQAVKTIANAIDNEEAPQLTVEEMLSRGWIAQSTLDQITNPDSLTNGEFYMLLRDVMEFYANVVYE